MLRRPLAIVGILFILSVQTTQAQITLETLNTFMHDWAVECLVQRYSPVWCKQLGHMIHPELMQLRPYFMSMDSIYYGMKAIMTPDELAVLRKQLDPTSTTPT
jgi:fumarate reductase subunit D